MSWNIYIYAEKRHFNDTEWHEVCDTCVYDNFKHYSDDFYEYLPEMSASRVITKSINSLCNSDDFSDFKVKCCNLNDFRSHYSKLVDDFYIKIKSLYLALGLRLNIDEDDYIITNCDNDADIYDDVNKLGCSYLKNMTFPVNRELFDDLTGALIEFSKAQQMIGFCDSVSAMCDFEDEVRLLFAVL